MSESFRITLLELKEADFLLVVLASPVFMSLKSLLFCFKLQQHPV